MERVETASAQFAVEELGFEYLAERQWWRNVMGPSRWKGKLVIKQGSLYASKEKISKIKIDFINRKIEEALENGHTVVISADDTTAILSAETNTLVFLSPLEAAKVIGRGQSRAVPALKGKLAAHVSRNKHTGEISSITYSVDDLPVTQFINPDKSLTPTIYTVENAQSPANHSAVLLLDEFKRGKKIVLKQTA
jgi:hypothetical protein